MIFSHELELMLKTSEYTEISVGNAIEIFLLFYADGIVLVADIMQEFHGKICVLEKFRNKPGMEVNLTKA